MKPRFGLMRGKQFLMKDMYSFDVDVETSKTSYKEVCSAYDKIFKQIGVNFIKSIFLIKIYNFCCNYLV